MLMIQSRDKTLTKRYMRRDRNGSALQLLIDAGFIAGPVGTGSL